MPEYQTLEKVEHKYKNTQFVEVSVRLAKNTLTTAKFVSIVRGYVDHKDRRWTKTQLTLPWDAALLAAVSRDLANLAAAVPAQAP